MVFNCAGSLQIDPVAAIVSGMDFRQLKTFRTVAELGSLSAASDRLRIAQPALSRQIKLLEHDLKTVLFIRHGRGMVLTQAGQMLLDRTVGVIRRLEQAREDILAVPGRPSGRVVVGMVPTVSSVLAARVAQRVVASLPGVQLRIVDAYGGFLVDWLHRGEIDLAVVYGPARSLHLSVEHIGVDQLLAIGATGSGLASRDNIPLEEVLTAALVLPSHPHSLRALIERTAADRDLKLDIAVEADSFQALVDIVTAGVGITFLPHYSIARALAAGLAEAAPMYPALNRELVLALPSQQPNSSALQAVAEIVRAEAAALVDRL